jgi:hypothetical protein
MPTFCRLRGTLAIPPDQKLGDLIGFRRLVFNIRASTRADWAVEQVRAGFMNNEGRMKEFRF